MADSGWWDYRIATEHDLEISPVLKDAWHSGRRGANAPYLFLSRAQITVVAANLTDMKIGYTHNFDPGSAGAYLYVSSSEAADTSKAITLLVVNLSGALEEVTVTTNAADGTTKVATTAKAIGFIAASKPATAGNILVTNLAGAEQYGYISQNDTYSIATWFHAPATGAHVISCIADIDAEPLVGAAGATLKSDAIVEGTNVKSYYTNTLIRTSELNTAHVPLLAASEQFYTKATCSAAVEITHQLTIMI